MDKTIFAIEIEEKDQNNMIEDYINLLVAEAVKHFNEEKRRVRCPENDARYFFQESELNTFLKQINYPEKIWVSTIKNDDGSFFAYRVGRIIPTKKGLKKI